MSRKIVVCYLRADSAVLDDHVLNRMAAFTAPRYATEDRDTHPIVHVELFFPNKTDDGNGLSAGICYGGQVFMHPKRFSRSNWEFHSIPATEVQVTRTKDFIDRQRGSGFNYRGFFTPRACGVPHSDRLHKMNTHRMNWYCSELTAYALLQGGLLSNENAYEASTHPNATYFSIENNCSTFVDCARNLKGATLSL